MRIRASGLALAFAVGACTAGPAPSPPPVSPTAPPPTAGVEPSASPGAPSDPPSPALPRTFDLTTGDSSGRALLLRVVDETGIVLSVNAAETLTPIGDASGPLLLQGIHNPGGDETVLAYGWTGGACDRSTTIVFRRNGEGFHLQASTDVDPGPCILIAFLRGVELHLAEQVAAASVTIGSTP